METPGSKRAAQQEPSLDADEETDKNGSEQNTDNEVLEKVGKVIATINEAKNVDQVIFALHSLAVRLFSLDSRAFAGSIDKQYRDEVIGAKVPSEHERDSWWQVFYRSTAFPTMARVLLSDVALNWLTCFPISAKKHLYDAFFLRGCVSDVVQTVVPYLQHRSNGRLETSVCSNAERLLAVCLVENNGVLELAREFSHKSENVNLQQHKSEISRVAQLVTSVPDKARLGASTLLSSHLYVKRITIQLIQGAEEWDKKYNDESTNSSRSDLNGCVLFIGDAFARICRRGSADVMLSEVIPRIITQVRSLLQPGSDLTVAEAFKSKLGFKFWSKIMEAIKDSYAVERISEQLLQKLATQNVNDVEGYWILWLLFHHIYELQASIRSMFMERFLLWKVFPICCLRWILQFSVLQCPPDTTFKVKSQSLCDLLDTTQRLLAVWSKREFVQSASIEQQAYLTAAVGLSLEKLKKEDLDATKDAMHLILQGVSCRLESPSHMVRKMASSVALVFSKVIDPSNPLYLDESFKEEIIDWEFKSMNTGMEAFAISDGKKTDIDQEKAYKDTKNKNKHKELMELALVDPDEVIDPATLNNDVASDGDNNDDDDHDDDDETSSESSLQPYDLSDDDTDLKKNFAQLIDVVGALRKSDDADGVERALDVAEKLIRAAPDELPFIAGDLVKTLVQVRCSDSTLEGEEETAEEKRQKALIALIVNCPIGSLNPLNKLLYSPNVDTSQRIMILDVMTDAALELSHATTSRPSRTQILTTAETQPWFMPTSIGSPGASTWKEISGVESPLTLTYSYERDLPNKPGEVRRGKSRRWSRKLMNEEHDNQVEWSRNKFPSFAAAFMLPAMQGFDRKRHGVDFLGRDFIVLGKLIHMLGSCMKCAAMHPEASALALPLLDMLSSREVSHHAEAYVRKSVLFAMSCILVALNPTYIASALVEGNTELSRGLEWVRTWALSVAESDIDKECYMMAMACLQLHSEMALQTSRTMESSDNTIEASRISLPSSLLRRRIKIHL